MAEGSKAPRRLNSLLEKASENMAPALRNHCANVLGSRWALEIISSANCEAAQSSELLLEHASSHATAFENIAAAMFFEHSARNQRSAAQGARNHCSGVLEAI